MANTASCGDDCVNLDLKLTFDLRFRHATHAVDTHFRLKPSSLRPVALLPVFFRAAFSLTPLTFTLDCSDCIAWSCIVGNAQLYLGRNFE